MNLLLAAVILVWGICSIVVLASFAVDTALTQHKKRVRRRATAVRQVRIVFLDMI